MHMTIRRISNADIMARKITMKESDRQKERWKVKKVAGQNQHANMVEKKKSKSKA